MTHYHHIDESGDPGLTTKSAFSRFFVIAMVQLPNRDAIIPFADLRRILHLSPDFEFHYKKMSSKQRDCFFYEILKLPFSVRAVYLDKALCSLSVRSLDGLDIMTEMITHLVLRSSPSDIVEDILVLDAAPLALRKNLRLRLTQECQRMHRSRPFKKIVSAESCSEEGLQLADMIAGAIRQHILHKNDLHFSTFENRIADITQFG